MLCRYYIPAAPLSDFIEDFWLYNDYRPAHLKERILPSGTTELVINLRDNELRVYDRVRPGLCERFSGAIVSGTYDGFFVIDTHVDLETLWGRSARELRDRLRTATAPIDKFRVLEAALLARLSGSVIRHGAVRFALHAFGGSNPTTVRDVSERVGLSQRRFSEVFKTEVGLTPKLLHRVQRFQRVLALARRATAPDWSRLALDCGFFDQSHLIRDFVAFSGFSPAEFLRHQQVLQRRGIPEAQPPPAGRIRVNFFQYADCARGDDEPCRLERDHQRWPR